MAKGYSFTELRWGCIHFQPGVREFPVVSVVLNSLTDDSPAFDFKTAARAPGAAAAIQKPPWC
jgi:hypothetical protein